MKKNRILFYTIILFFFFILSPINVFAGSAAIGFSGDSSVTEGKTITITMYVSNVSGTDNGVVSLSGNLSFDSSYLEYVSGSGASSPYQFQINTGANYIIAGLDTSLSSGIKTYTTVFTFVFRAKRVGNTTITLNNATTSDTSSKLSTSVYSKTITINEPPSTNNYLSSLSVSNGAINFNKDTTNYNLTVASNVTSINISATTEDYRARISGTGSKNLGYGANTFYIVVTAQSGATKTYNITVNRKDDRSTNNNLSSLSVKDGTINFNKNTTKYELSVPYSVSKLNINAIAEDPKAKVNISNTDLVAEETRDINITVIAENGREKVYTLSVARGKDPNKKLSNNNYLSILSVDVGILSPLFNKDTTSYEVWLPYEIEQIKFNYDVEDKKYAITKIEGNEKLKPGINNVYKINVTAENEEVRTYTINVKRASNPKEKNNNTYLKSIEVKNGELTSEFNKEQLEYYYTSNKDFKVKNAIPEDENSSVTIYEVENTIYLVVTSSDGSQGIYTLRKKESSIFNYIIPAITFIIGLLLGLILKKAKKEKKEKKEKYPKKNN